MSNNRYRYPLDRNRNYRGGYNSGRGGFSGYRRYSGPPIRKAIAKRSFYGGPERYFRDRFRTQHQNNHESPIRNVRDSPPRKRIEFIRKGGRSEPVIVEKDKEKEEVKEPIKKEPVKREEKVKPTELRVENLDLEVTNSDLKVRL